MKTNKSLKQLEDNGFSNPIQNMFQNVNFNSQQKSSINSVAKALETKTNKLVGQQQNMARSSSAKGLDREENPLYEAKLEQKISNINGNIIHVTVNNFLGPLLEPPSDYYNENKSKLSKIFDITILAPDVTKDISLQRGNITQKTHENDSSNF